MADTALLSNPLWARERANLEAKRDSIEEICRRYGVARLSLFGSITRPGDFHTESDVDFLVGFLPGVSHGIKFIEMELDLEDLIERRTQLKTAKGLSRYFRDEVVAEAEVFMPRREETYLRKMLDAVRAVADYIEGYTFDSFRADRRTSDAVVFQMIILSEAAKAVSETTCQKHPEVAWRSLKRTRDSVVHAYFAIDYPFVWKSTTETFSTLRTQLEQVLEAEYGTKN